MSIASAQIELARAVPLEIELERRGVVLKGRVERVGPCPVCGGNDRFAVNTRKRVWLCRACHPRGGDVIALAMHIDGSCFVDAVKLLAGAQVQRPQSPQRKREIEPDNEPDKSTAAAWLWSQRQPAAENGPVARYLRWRGFTGQIPATLAWLPARGSHGDAMIAAFGVATEGDPGIIEAAAAVTGVHLTRLAPNGVKAPDPDGKAKIMLGRSLGQPLVLSPPNDLLGLAICEGIETGLSIYQSTGLGVWVAGAAGRMPALADVIPPYIECVTVYREADQAGQRGAEEFARRLAETRDTEVFMTEI